ncbi:helix-turn-helix domain-containing protein [Rhodococcus jostii]|uniref:helix-turn-helix domain-containing protein n=1 Tax=Rhodococcus jostii TaxID=132919 RepID=UPI0036283EBE
MAHIDNLTAAAVRDAYKSVGATIESLSDDTGIPATTLKRRLAGKTSFQLDQLALISEALDVPIERLIPTTSGLHLGAA